MKQRIVNDGFWTDPYIEDLTATEKLVFLYLLTNPLCNIAWIYEIKRKRMAYELDIDKNILWKILEKLEKDSKIILYEDWIIIKNFAKHQSKNPNVIKWMQRIIDSLPYSITKIKGFESLYHFTLLNLTKPNSNKNILEKESEWDFEKIWNLYPKKEKKIKSKEEFEKINQNEYELIIKSLEKFNKKLKKENIEYRYIPFFYTWLKDKRYLDESYEKKDYEILKLNDSKKEEEIEKKEGEKIIKEKEIIRNYYKNLSEIEKNLLEEKSKKNLKKRLNLTDEKLNSLSLKPVIKTEINNLLRQKLNIVVDK